MEGFLMVPNYPQLFQKCEQNKAGGLSAIEYDMNWFEVCPKS
jgi:hypothetical protein